MSIKYIEIQPPTPRFESVRMVLAEHAWNNGIATFFTENVPFSYSTGKVLANKIGNIFSDHMVNRYGVQLPEKLVIYELGGGMGLLAKHLLEHLRHNAPRLYERVHLCLSDRSPATVKQWRKIGLFDEFAGKVTLHVMDATAPNFAFGKPDFVYCSYMLDSLPTRVIKVENNNIYEMQVQSYLPSDAKIFDTTQFPPKLLNALEIRELFKATKHKIQNNMANKIIQLLKIEWHAVPLKEVSNMSAAERSAIEHLCQDLSIKDAYFNFSFQIMNFARKVFAAMDHNALLFVHDFGYTDNSQHLKTTELLAAYGCTAASPVFFPQLFYKIDKSSLYYASCGEREGGSQIVLISKNKRLLNEIFKQDYSYFEGTQIKERLKKLDEHANVDEYFAKIKDFLSSINNLQAQDYYVNISIATQLIRLRELNEAKSFLKINVQNYGKVALSSIVLLARIARLEKNYEESRAYLNDIFSVTDAYNLAILERYSLAVSENNHEEAAESLKLLCAHSPDVEIPSILKLYEKHSGCL